MVQVGQKVKMDGERQRYTVQAASDRYVILTKPFNARKTYLYSIVDLKRKVRGRCNLIFGLPFDVNTHESALLALGWLHGGRMQVTYRNCKDLSGSELKQLKGLRHDQ